MRKIRRRIREGYSAGYTDEYYNYAESLIKDYGLGMDPRELLEEFNEFFDDIYEEVKFGELSYLPSEVLATVDPIAYKEALGEYVSNNYGDTETYAESRRRSREDRIHERSFQSLRERLKRWR